MKNIYLEGRKEGGKEKRRDSKYRHSKMINSGSRSGRMSFTRHEQKKISVCCNKGKIQGM